MKKIKFISAIALTLVMASCENFDLPNPPGQTNPNPDGYFENSGLALSQGEATVNLKNANDNNVDVTVANVTELVNFPTDYTLSIDMQVSGSDNFANAATIATTLVGDEITVNPDILNGAIQKAITKKPGTYDIYARYIAYAELGTTRMRLGGLNAFYAGENGAPFKYSITTLDPAMVIEDAYYLVPCNNGTPDLSKAIKMNNTGGASVSPYDNPEFAIKTTVTEAQATAGYEWKIASQSALTAGDASALYGCNPAEDNELTGKIQVGYAPGVIHLQGDVLVTINVELQSYTVNYAFEVLYPFTSGNTNKPNEVLTLTTNDYIQYTGVAMLNNIWYLAAQPDYRGAVVFKQDKELGFTDSENGLTREGVLTASSDADKSESLRTPAKGKHLYWMDINLVQLTYSITALETLSVIGAGNGWDLATAVALTPSANFDVWTANDVEIGDEFKINANGAWDIGFSGTGGKDSTGKFVYTVNKQDGGDNLKCSEPGKYNVTVDFSAHPYTVTLSK